MAYNKWDGIKQIYIDNWISDITYYILQKWLNIAIKYYIVLKYMEEGIKLTNINYVHCSLGKEIFNEICDFNRCSILRRCND